MANAQLLAAETLGSTFMEICRIQDKLRLVNNEIMADLAKLNGVDASEEDAEVFVVPPMRMVSPIDDPDYLFQSCECPLT